MSSSKVIEEVLSRYGRYPVALTGCRTTEHALECCEYDFVVVSDDKLDCLLQVGNDYAEIHSLTPKTDPLVMTLSLQRMRVVNDPALILASLKQEVDKVQRRALDWHSRKKAADALFYANSSLEAASEDAPVSSLWLKCAAYHYIEAALARIGEMSMPLHMLAQLRSVRSAGLAGGMALATSCLALERANRSSVARCIEASVGLNEKLKQDHSARLVRRKAEFLYGSGLYADCYFYLGYAAREAATGILTDRRALRDYMLMLTIAMDLTSDQSFTLKLSRELRDACNDFLKAA